MTGGDPDGTDADPGEGLAGVVEEFRRGSPRGLSRAISAVEDEEEGFEALLDRLHAGVGRARRIGITGPPGAGKSTLTAALARRIRKAGHTVGIVAVDPTSPFTGGALLGDRIRMGDLATEEGVFIRSMATRGSPGGLATGSREVADLMDAFGFDRVILETVGVGQSELEVANSADSTVVVLVPESGDGIQAMKAGLMEVADLFVVNKADRPGADRLRKEIEVMGKLRRGRASRAGAGHHGFGGGEPAAAGSPSPEDAGGEPAVGGAEATGGAPEREAPGWRIPVLETVASEDEGVGELLARLDDHFEHMESTGELAERRREQLLEQAHAVLARRGRRRSEELWRRHGRRWADDLAAGRMTPYEVANAVAGAGREEA